MMGLTVLFGATLYRAATAFSRLIPSITFRLGIVGHELRLPQSKESDIMKRKISVYWPLALFVALAAAACLYANGESAARNAQAPLAADQLSAELARTVSYGLVGGDAVAPVKHMRSVAAMPAAQVS
jgi:hypothetical protein